MWCHVSVSIPAVDKERGDSRNVLAVIMKVSEDGFCVKLQPHMDSVTVLCEITVHCVSKKLDVSRRLVTIQLLCYLLLTLSIQEAVKDVLKTI